MSPVAITLSTPSWTNAIQEHGFEAAEDYILLSIEGDEQSVYAQPEELVEFAKEQMGSKSR